MPSSLQNAPQRPPITQRGLRQAVLACSLLAICAGALAQSFDEEFDDEEKPWQEIAVQLPPTPQQQNLAEFYLSPNATMKAYVDLNSVSIGTDKVVRYTVLTKTEGGAVNVMYEGMRCETWEKKTYAFGHPDGKWSRSRRDKWQPIRDIGANRIDGALFRDYFCDGKMIADNENLKSIVNRLKTQTRIDPVRR
ncbi:CNP1-like family protein [Herbaspirillum frisingense]|uniref:CNP1-like family protein n=1 Tax=Herbaspirillum frisingense TaxID=92645 RepID=UPI001F280789|nr:CNP1-like family protein [Herbaspirillum frisingense]UIN21840.1 CNP1-like family protein [Herbaspirillum frisingense]